jgi:diacylglycerol kinase family enzyme
VRVTVIYNPKAGDRGWSKGAVQERLRAAGHEPVMVSSQGRWRGHLDDGSDAIVAAGGDGTVHKLALALAGSERRLAIIPLGTANNLARAIGYEPGSDPFARAHEWGEAERTLRVECARRGRKSAPFLEVMGAGAFARLLARDDGKKKAFPLATLLAARRKLLDQILGGPMFEATATVDGRHREGRYVLLACLRIASFGPALHLAPQQRPDDERLTVVGVRNDQREAFGWWLATGEGGVAQFTLGRGRCVELRAPGPLHVDDRLIDDDDGRPRALTAGGAARLVHVLV